MQWVARLLGLDVVIEAKEKEIEGLYVQLRDALERNKQKDAEIQRLTDLMLTRAGFIQTEKISQPENKPQPINKRERWPSKQKRLEQEDAKKQADAVERQWRAKEAAQEQQSNAS
jgi:hypothetical protein